MVGFGDNAGSGIPTILSAWKQADWLDPELSEDTQLNQVTLTLKTLAIWTKSVVELRNTIVHQPGISEENASTLRNALSVYNLGISPEVRANMTEVAKAVSNAMESFKQLDLLRLNEDMLRFAELSKMIQPVSDNTINLARLVSEVLKANIESADKSANSNGKSANSNGKSADKSPRGGMVIKWNY